MGVLKRFMAERFEDGPYAGKLMVSLYAPAVT